MALNQDTRQLSLTTPLGENVLVLTRFSGSEIMSGLFQFQLEMISDNANISPKDIVGKNVTFSVRLADDSPRFFNGFVTRFFAGNEDKEGRRNYRAEVAPWLWFLTRTSDCRIFQNMTAPDIIEQVFGDLGFSDYKLSAQGTHPEREYCVQYRETDYNFVSRLMEEEGLYYFFEHQDGKHEMIIADKPTGYIDCVESTVDFPGDHGGRNMDDHLTSWEHHYEFRTGKWAQTDYDFKNPTTDLMNHSDSVLDLPGIGKYEHYDYPGLYVKKADGKGLTDVRMEEDEVDYDVVHGTSMCRSFTTGGKFKVGKHISASEEGRKYVLTSVRHRAAEPQAYESGSGSAFDYANSFTCVPDKVIYRPARTTPKPFVQGVQTAVITGPAGEEIYVDEFGRVKVQFHWDREGKKDDKSSCWIRVSQNHAGKSFGAIHIPRIDEEVIVSFLEGDPDRPIITGRVYHAENMPPYGLPDSKKISGMKSKTYKGEGYNEYVMDDTPGEELIREHGQFDKDSTIEHDLREHVLNDRSRDVTNNETVIVGVDRTKTVKNNEVLNVGVDRTRTVGQNETVTIENNRTISVNGTHTETIEKDTTIKITEGNLDQTVAAGNGTFKVKGAVVETFENKQQTTVSNEIEIKSKGQHIHLTAQTEIKLEVGGSTLLMKSDGSIELSGTNIAIKGSESVNIAGNSITSQADADHNTKGNIVLSEGAGTNTVKGGMVMLNP